MIPVPTRIECPTCDGAGEVRRTLPYNPAFWPSDDYAPCQACDDGMVPNPDYEPGLVFCWCAPANILAPGDSCTRCSAEVPA